MEYKSFGLEIKSTEKQTVNGQEVGIFKGHASTFDIDSDRDQMVPGVFNKALSKLRQSGTKQIQMKFMHKRDEVIGGFPISEAREDNIGLFVEGNVNLEVQKGRETFALLKQGVFKDMSIGFFIDNAEFDTSEQVRKIDDISLFEISVVDLPANTNANILEVKTVTPFLDLPLADQDRPWDADAAIQRVRAFTDSLEAPSRRYRRAFMWFDGDDANQFTAYKLPYADVIDGELKAVPRGLFAVRGVLAGARGGVDIPEADQARIRVNVNRYFEKMGLEAPFKSKKSSDLGELKSIREVDDFLKEMGLSNKDANILISKVKSLSPRDDGEGENFLKGVDEFLLTSKLEELLKATGPK